MIPIRLETAEGKLVSDKEFLPDGYAVPAVVVCGARTYVPDATRLNAVAERGSA
jgi:hypothetical protein